MFQLGAAQCLDHMLRAAGVCGDEGQVDFCLKDAGQIYLGPFRGVTQPLQSHAVGGQVDAGLVLEFVDHPFQYELVEVVATQECVAVGGLNFKYAVAHLEDCDVKRPSAKVEHRDGGVGLGLVQPVGQRRCGRLVDDAQHFQPGNGAGVFGCLALGVVEVGRNRDHGLGYLLPQLGFCVLFNLLQYKSRDLGRGVGFFAQLHHGVSGGSGHDLVGQLGHCVLDFRVLELPAHEPFHGKKSVLRICYCLPLGDLANVTFSGFGVQCNDGRGDAAAFSVLHDHGFTGFDDCRYRVGCAEVDSQDFSHYDFS